MSTIAQDAFDQNDQLDRQRLFLVLSGFASALGVDPGPPATDGTISNPVGQFQVLNVTTGQAPQGQASTLTATVAGHTFTLPALLVLAVGAWLVLR